MTPWVPLDNLALNCLVAFFGGALYESACVGWTHYAEKGRPLPAALFGMLCALAQVAGIGESISTLAAAPFFVLGYGFGTFMAVHFKTRWLTRQPRKRRVALTKK